MHGLVIEPQSLGKPFERYAEEISQLLGVDSACSPIMEFRQRNHDAFRSSDKGVELFLEHDEVSLQRSYLALQEGLIDRCNGISHG